MEPVVIAGAVTTAVTALALVWFKWRDLSVEIRRDTEWHVMWHERVMDETDGPQRP